MPRLSRGCLRCRQRKVRCDEGRPCCQRCITRNEVCIGYRDESDLIFRHETNKVIGSTSATRGGQIDSPPVVAPAHMHGTVVPHELRSHPAPPNFHHSRQRQRQRSSSVGCHRGKLGLVSSVTGQTDSDTQPQLFPFYPSTGNEIKYFSWLHPASRPPPPPHLSESDGDAIQAFFTKYVLLPHDFATSSTGSKEPGHQRASQGFLEFLPCTFEEVNVQGRLALRWAVQAAALADASSHLPRLGGLGETDHATGRGARLDSRPRALEYYGKALSALSESLGAEGKVPDDYDLMTVVVLDLFESLFLPDAVSRSCHAQGMSHILRKRGLEQLYDARGWSLFRLAHHRLQKQALAFNLPPAAVSKELLGYLDEHVSFVKIEKDATRVLETCARGRKLRAQLKSDGTDTSAIELLSLVREMQALDREAVGWRNGPEWSYATLKTSDLHGDANVVCTFPTFVHIHPDIWTAYEWNYHRCSRIILHKQLLACLHRAAELSIDDAHSIASLLPLLEIESITIIQHLTSEILATVPQMLGDINHTGQVRRADSPAPHCRAIGAYFLLWPMKILKGELSEIISEKQKGSAADVMEKIREFTGMKNLLGDASII